MAQNLQPATPNLQPTMDSGHSHSFAYLLEHTFCVGPHTVDPRANTIIRGDETLAVEPKVMRVLVGLAATPGDVVSREVLHATVWPETIVSDNVLTRAVSELRKALGDSSRNPQFIETISKGGYRLMVSVTEPQQPAQADDFDWGGDSLVPPIVVVPHIAQPQSRRGKWWLGLGIVVFVGVLWILVGGLQPRTESQDESFISGEPITSYRGHELQPHLSPDGNMVVYVWQGENSDNWDLYLQQPGTPTPMRRTTHPGDDVQPVWSPDGRHLAFRRYEGQTCSIIMVAALAGPERVLAPCYGTTAPNRVHWSPRLTWSPDGTWLAYASRTSAHEPISIYRLSLETFEQERVTNPDTTWMGDIQPAYAPDGQTIAYVRFEAWGRSELYTVSLEDGEEQKITNKNHTLRGHTWTPDGRHLLFSSDLGGTFDFWKIPAQGGQLVWVPATGWNVKQPEFAQNGDLVYENWVYDTNVWYTALDATQAESHVVVTSTRWDEHPRLSPDGSSLAFVSNRSGSYELWLSDADGRNAAQLTFFGDAIVRAPAWSPTNEELAFEVRRGREVRVYILSIEDGQVVPFSDPARNGAQPQWTLDGQSLLYAVYDQNRWQIVKQALETSRVQAVTQPGGYTAQEASDGSIYFAKSDQEGIWRKDLQSDLEVLVLPQLRVGDWGNWELTEEGIIYVDRGVQGTVTLKLYPFEGSASRTLFTFENPPLVNQRGLTVRADGLGVYHTQLDETESDIMYMKARRPAGE